MPHKNSEANQQIHVDNLKPTLQDGATFFLLTVATGIVMREMGLPPACLCGTVFAAAPLAIAAYHWRVQPSKEWLTQNPPQK
jgi:hypothetical protein